MRTGKGEGQAQDKLLLIMNQLGPLPDNRNDFKAVSGQSVRWIDDCS